MTQYSADRLIQIAIALSAEKNISLLLDRILTEAMDMTGCDAGTVYIREEDHLSFGVMITRSKGVHRIRQEGETLLPPVPLSRTHVCACAALERKLINIEDVYQDSDYNFAGTRRYDEMNGYRTQSMLVAPMEDDQGQCIGVVQLINALDGEGRTIPFSPETESVILALGSLAAVSLNNTLLQRAVTDLLHSFVTTMVDAIDARSPYNANHTRSMVRYAERFVDWLSTHDGGWRISEEEKDPFLMSVWLHDVGKLVVPLEIMDKPTRLGALEGQVKNRIQIAQLMEKLRALEHPEQAEEAEKKQQTLNEASAVLWKINTASYLPDDMLAQLKDMEALTCLSADGLEIPLLQPEEMEALCVRKGTLTAGERREMERHVVHTKHLLDHMKFSGIYQPVPDWAAAHHELLNGTGYPCHLKSEQLPREVRLLTILDIYDALTAEDRPYKPPMPPEKAFSVLENMRDNGQLDGDILALFKESGAWKKTV
ncbi:MAG: GAF domain-containing protein [Clostridia bacterium]|nr:GAF domain-containing protein [Clostridia bacterium]